MLPTHNPDTPSGPSRRLSLFSFRRISGRGLLLLCLFAITVLIWLTAPIPPYHDLSVPRLRPLRPGPGPGPGPGDSETPQPEWAPPDVTSGGNPVYLLRPETVESLYVMWKTTGEEKWRERGWEIFSAIERHARTPHGYASVERVDSDPVHLIDDMPSFFLAETLKYLYLLFDDTASSRYPFDKWVFNTEAHPLPLFRWAEWEKEAYNITA